MAGEEELYEPSSCEMPEGLLSPQAQEPEPDSGGAGGTKWPGWPGENVFRILVPVQKVGSIIGRKGEFVKKITEETRARIRVLDAPTGTSERAVLVSAKEEPDVPIPPAMEGLLRVHKQIVGLESDPAQPVSGARSTVTTRLLVADTQAGCLIGKQGSTIKSIQDASDCIIRILGAEHLPPFALQDDSVVEIQGEPTGVHKAVELIASNLRKFLVDRSIVGVFETKMQMAYSRANQNMPMPQLLGPHGFEMNADGGDDFGPNQYIQPPRQYGSYYSHNDLPPFDEHPHQGPPAYGRDASMGGHLPNVQPQQSIVTKVTKHMQIPLSYADAVIGTSGANISYIRRASGAAITAQETRGVPGEMTVEINGSASQVQAAQQLIQNFMAEAESSMKNPAGGSINQEYIPYPPAQGQMFASAPSHAASHASHAPSGDYGSEYGSAYGSDYGSAYGSAYGSNYGY